MKQFFDADRVVRYPELSLAGGAIRGWDRRNAYYFSMIQSLAKHYDFDIELPWKKLPAKIQKILLHGSGEEKIQFHYLTGHGVSISRKHKFEGILPNLERRYRETESGMVREELAKFLSTQPCPDCKGTRLNTAARNVFVSGKSIPEVTTMSVGHALEFFGALNLEGWRGEIAAKVVKEIQSRLQFLADVGLEYLSLDRSAETLSGGEAQRIRLASQIGSGLVGVMYILDEPSIGLHQRDNKRLLEHPHPPARHRQHGDRGRARRGSHRRQRPRRRSRPRRGRARRPDRGPGHPGGDHGPPDVHHRPVPVGPQAGPGADATARGRRRPLAHDPRRPGQQPEEPERPHSARRDDLRHRRIGVGQVHAGQRHALPVHGGEAERPAARRPTRPATASTAWTRWTG